MVKHTQKIRRQQPTNYLSVFEHFVELALKEFKEIGSAFHYNSRHIFLSTIR